LLSIPGLHITPSWTINPRNWRGWSYHAPQCHFRRFYPPSSTAKIYSIEPTLLGHWDCPRASDRRHICRPRYVALVLLY
jgi:hypothetical protein